MYGLGLGENDLEGRVEVKGVGERIRFALLLDLTMDAWSLGAFNGLSKECGLQRRGRGKELGDSGVFVLFRGQKWLFHGIEAEDGGKRRVQGSNVRPLRAQQRNHSLEIQALNI